MNNIINVIKIYCQFLIHRGGWTTFPKTPRLRPYRDLIEISWRFPFNFCWLLMKMFGSVRDLETLKNQKFSLTFLIPWALNMGPQMLPKLLVSCCFCCNFDEERLSTRLLSYWTTSFGLWRRYRCWLSNLSLMFWRQTKNCLESGPAM